MEANQPIVSIIILNWNGLPDVQKCVAHILAQDYKAIELIVVDNGSTDGSLQLLKKLHTNLHFIENGTNLGFAKGMNIGIARSTGEFVIPLNQDAFLTPGFVSASVAAISDDGSLGSVAGPVLSALETDATTGHIPETGIILKAYFRGVTPTDPETQHLLGPMGCCPFFRRSALEDVKLAEGAYFDEMYVTGGEDLDLYLRLQLRNWSCKYSPQAIAYHVGSGAVDRATRLVDKPLWYQRNALRNRYYSIIKDLPGPLLSRLLPYIVAAEIGMWLYYLLTSPRTLVALLWAWKDLTITVPSVLRKRRHIQSRRTSTISRLSLLFT